MDKNKNPQQAKNNRIIQPQKREKTRKKKKVKASFNIGSSQKVAKKTKKSSSVEKVRIAKMGQSIGRKNSAINKEIFRSKTMFSGFNKLKFIEILTKLQIGFIIIIIVMVLLNKYDILQNLIEDEISVFGEESTNKLTTIGDVQFEENDSKTVIGVEDIEFEEKSNQVNNSIVSYMKGNSFDEIFRDTYVVDSRAGVVNSMFDFENFESKDLTLTEPTSTEPKVLIFHTHGSEQYKDSEGIDEGVYLLGRTLEEELEEKYGINTLHIEKRYDEVEGKTQILGAYERMEPDILAILEKYPSIEVCIDIHRDGLPGDMKQTVEIDGEVYAPLMFVNGLSSYNNNGTIETLTELNNPNREDNLAFSYRMKQAVNSQYSGLMKDIYINAYRYSLHMKPKSLLLEVGAQNNTVDEAVRSTVKFAEILAEVLKGEE